MSRRHVSLKDTIDTFAYASTHSTTQAHATIQHIVNGAIASLPDPNQKIRELWGCLEEPNGDGGPYTRNVTPSFDNNTAARCISKKNSVLVEWLRQSERGPSVPSETPRCQYNMLCCISPSDRCFTVSSRYVGLLF